MISLESIWYGQMSVLHYEINKAVLFLFHSLLLALQMYASCSHFLFSFHNLTCMDLVLLFLFSFPRLSVSYLFTGLESESLKIFCQFIHFLPQQKKLDKRFYFYIFFFFSNSPFLLAIPHCPSLNSLNFLFLLCLQQDLLLDLLPSQKEVLFFRQGGPSQY